MIIAPRHHAGVLIPLIWVSIVAHQHLCDTFLLSFVNHVRYISTQTALPLPILSTARLIGRGRGAMTFEEILDQALAMVQRRGRVTYRTLKLQFALDDEQLATLKDELLYSQPYVVDDAGRGLLWTGEADVSPPTTLQVPQSATPGPPLTTQAAHPP